MRTFLFQCYQLPARTNFASHSNVTAQLITPHTTSSSNYVATLDDKPSKDLSEIRSLSVDDVDNLQAGTDGVAAEPEVVEAVLAVDIEK